MERGPRPARRKWLLQLIHHEGTRGIFDVYVDDRLVFSKHAEQRFPERGEIVRLIREGGAAGSEEK